MTLTNSGKYFSRNRIKALSTIKYMASTRYQGNSRDRSSRNHNWTVGEHDRCVSI